MGILTVYIFGLSVYLLEINAYVLLQVRKQDANHSNVDALIHKIVPSENHDKMAKNISRKQYDDQSSIEAESRDDDGPDIESVLFAINTGAEKKREGPPSRTGTNMMAAIKKTILQVAQRAAPIFRAKTDQYDIEPEILNFRSKGKPSMMFEVNSESLVDAMKDLLASATLQKFVGKMARKAAVVYRAMQDDNMSN